MAEAPAPSSHVLDELGFVMEPIEGDVTRGRAVVAPGLCLPGTGQVRIGVLATYADLVAGFPPEGPVHPTVDLNVRLIRRPEGARTILLEGRTIRSGRTLVVREVLARTDDDPDPFAVSVSTFMARSFDMPDDRGGRWSRAERPMVQPIATRIGARGVAPGVVEVDRHPDVVNGAGGTIQGGIVATLAELAAETALADEGRWFVQDLDVRYLRGVRVGPARAEATVVGRHRDEATVRVEILDAGDGGKAVTYGVAVCRPLSAA